MNESLFKTFRDYLNLLSSRFRNSRGRAESIKKQLSLYINTATKMEGYENSIEFQQLVDESRKEPSLVLYGFLKGKGIWEHAVRSFFRRSGCYNAILENNTISVDDVFKRYLQAFQRSNIQRTYLVPMGLVYFSEKSMDFGSFQIRQLTKRELINICQSKNEVFYPYAHIPSNQLNLLQDCWFICITESVHRSKEDYFSWDEISQAKLEYTLHPGSVELVLNKLALFDWQLDQMRESPSLAGRKGEGEDKERFWQGFEVPFIIVLDDDLLTSPPRRPDISKLRTVPHIHPQTGEEIGEIPETAIHFDEKETAAFKDFILQIEGIFVTLTPLEQGWKFLEIALGFLVKAFFADGLEQLLWHITALEALLGENAEGLRQRLASRIALICGKTKTERKNLRKQFLDLYDFRCDLVHGNVFQKQAYVGHLYTARSLSQRTLLWFLHCLKEIKKHSQGKPEEGITPTRKDILLSIDLDYNKRSRLSWLNKELPDEFPYVPNWIK